MPRLPLVRRVVAVDTYCQDLANLPSLESLALTSEPIDRPMMRQILSLPKLTELEIVNCRLAAVDLGELAALDRLKKLSLQTMRLEKQQFDGLGKLTQLEELEIGACDLFHAHFRQLSSMPNLRRVDVVGGGFTSATIPHLASLTQVESLTLGSATIDLHVARHICRMPRLRELELTFCRVDEEAAECLVGMKPLQVLHLPEGFSAESQEKLQAMMGDRKVTFLDYNRVFLK
jgi:hypothetical protein